MRDYLSTAMAFSQYVVGKCARENEPISNLRLQEMLYMLQSVYCRATNGKLIFETEFQAWPYGPVIENVYRKFSKYGGDFIDECCDVMTPGFIGPEKYFIDAGIELLRRKSPWFFVRTSHAPGSPWDLIYRNGDGYKETIPNELVITAALMEKDEKSKTIQQRLREVVQDYLVEKTGKLPIEYQR